MRQMQSFFRSPWGRGLQQAALVLAGFAALAGSGVIDCGDPSRKSLGPVGPDVAVVTRLILTPAPPYTGNVLQPIVFTVKAVDASGAAVRDAQNGITLEFFESNLQLDLTDAPDADNAVVQVTARPAAPSIGGQVSVIYANPGGATITESFDVLFSTGTARLVVSPAGPLTLRLNESVPVTITALDPNNGIITGADRFIEVLDTDGGILSSADFEFDPGEPSGDGILRGRIVARRLVGDGTDDVTFLTRNPQVSTRVDVTIIEAAPSARVVASSPTATTIPGSTISLTAILEDPSGNPFPAGEALVQATSSNPAVATIESRVPDDGDGFVEFRVRAVAVGTAEIRFTYPGATTAVTALSVVSAPAGRVVASPSSGQVHVGQTIAIDARVVDGAGNLVPGSDAFVTAQIFGSGGATIVSRSEGTPGDGIVTYTIRGDTAGFVIVAFDYPGTQGSGTATLTVIP
ncbi:MAG: hypothetical protein ABR559_08780 [Gemmatimonadota bacterium]